MEGKFSYSSSLVFFCALGTAFGAALMLAFPYLLMSGVSVELDTKFGFGIMCVIGLIYFLLCNGVLFMKRKARITVDEKGIIAFCHYGCALDCSFSDIQAVSQFQKKMCITLKNGKRYILWHLENADVLAHFIHEKMGNGDEKSENAYELISEARRLQGRANVLGIAAILSFLFLFGVIIGTAALTGWRDMNDFTRGDWQKFAVMCGMLIAVGIVFILFLRGYTLRVPNIEAVKQKIFKKLLTELPPNVKGAVALYVNDEYAPQVRAAVYRISDVKSQILLETLNRNFEIEVIGEPIEYESLEELHSGLEGWFEISKPSSENGYLTE